VAAVVVTNGTQLASQITLHGLSFGNVAFHGNGAKTSMIFLGAADWLRTSYLVPISGELVSNIHYQ
jgi:hypothetical protein